MLEMKTIWSGYRDSMVLKGLSLQVREGEITTILGRNGCGKTTLMKTLIGLLPVRSGEILLDGEAVPGAKELSKKVAYLSQSKNIPDITAGRYVLHGRFPYLSYPRRYSKTDLEIAENAMKRMGVLELWDSPLCELSGGMRQKVYLAMALAKQAPVVLMDEPTTYLDIGQQRLFAETVKDLASSGKTVVLVLHDVLFALKLSDRICVMEDGIVKETGTPEEVLRSGILRRLYDVDIGIVETPEGTSYYYQ